MSRQGQYFPQHLAVNLSLNTHKLIELCCVATGELAFSVQHAVTALPFFPRLHCCVHPHSINSLYMNEVNELCK